MKECNTKTTSAPETAAFLLRDSSRTGISGGCRGISTPTQIKQLRRCCGPRRRRTGLGGTIKYCVRIRRISRPLFTGPLPSRKARRRCTSRTPTALLRSSRVMPFFTRKCMARRQGCGLARRLRIRAARGRSGE